MEERTYRRFDISNAEQYLIEAFLKCLENVCYFCKYTSHYVSKKYKKDISDIVITISYFPEQKLNLSNMNITKNDNDKYPHYGQINLDERANP